MADECGHKEWIIRVSELIPSAYDGDEAVESLLIRYLEDMQHMAGIIARLTYDYRSVV